MTECVVLIPAHQSGQSLSRLLYVGIEDGGNGCGRDVIPLSDGSEGLGLSLQIVQNVFNREGGDVLLPETEWIVLIVRSMTDRADVPAGMIEDGALTISKDAVAYLLVNVVLNPWQGTAAIGTRRMIRPQ